MVSTDFALGFIAGEGNFSLVKKTYSGKDKTYCAPRFQLGVDTSDSYVVLEIREVFGGIGSVYDSGDEFKWTVNGEDDMEKMCNIIDNHDDGPWLATQKREAYQTWKKMVDIYSGGPCDDQDRVEMARLARDEELNVGAGGNDAEWDAFLSEYANRNVYPDGEPI